MNIFHIYKKKSMVLDIVYGLGEHSTNLVRRELIWILPNHQ